VSAPPESVTVVHEPLNVSQAPPARAVSSRSTTPLVASMPAPESEPLSTVRSTALEYQGPSFSETDWPLGAVVSGVTVKVPVLSLPAPFVTVTVLAPLAVSHALQE
jgi:hypothetical protein